MSEVSEVDAQSMSSVAASDVLVVVFETRQAVAADVAVPEVGPTVADAVDVADVDSVDAIDASDPNGTAVTAGRWMVEGGRLVLAQGEAVAAGWTTGSAALVQSGEPKNNGLFVAQKEVVAGALPAAMTALLGGEVKVFDETREVCVARVGADFAIDAKLVHMADSWGEDDKEIAPTHTADEVFEKGLTLMSAGLEPLMGDCTKGLWAMPVAAKSPVLFRKAAIAPSLARKAVAAFRALPAWHVAQKAMLTFWGDSPAPVELKGKRWDTLDGTKVETTLYRSHDGARSIVVVTSDSHQGCGHEGQQLTSLFELTGEGKEARFTELASMPWFNAPHGISDIEADGQLEVFASPSDATKPMNLRIERWHSDRPAATEENGWKDEQVESVERLEIPDITYWGCGC